MPARRKLWTAAEVQGYTPFEGIELHAAVEETYLRGRRIYRGGRVLGAPTGR